MRSTSCHSSTKKPFEAIDLEAAEPLAEPLAELLNMGFPLAAAQRALQRCSGLWEAVDQLLQGG